MNEHLEPVFKIVLPKITSAKILYWVYGGVGFAAMVGHFYRRKRDVDLFVLDDDFKEVETILDNLCKENSWEICKTSLKSGRPKIDLFIKEKERLSVMPVYKTKKCVEFKFYEGSEEYDPDILTPVKHELDGYEFQTPKDIFLKSLFIGYLESKPKYPDPKKRLADANHVLTPEGVLKYFPTNK